ncbi:hypothetical protein LTR37_014345 [Vermiconidia calcicola]|uniref:Uncharacterized protein n=1 Tax=Vermiconidia calcicola TaxID=1690605 RepID=A0ACC3MTW4_9PEZI|nr:hypothetical protein LTR37_014345 [Vermiconidia calcicola]
MSRPRQTARKSAPSLGHTEPSYWYIDDEGRAYPASTPSNSDDDVLHHRDKQTARKSVRKRTPTPELSLSDSEGEEQILKRYFKAAREEEAELPDGNAAKKRKISGSPPMPAVAETNQDLEAQIQELHEFIGAQGLLLKAPLSIRKRLEAQEKAPQYLASAIKHEMQEAGEDCENCYELSQALLPWLDEICRLSRLPLPEALGLAIDTMSEFALTCCGDEKWWSEVQRHDRPADRPADFLFCSLIKQRLRRAPPWDATKILEELTSTWDLLREFNLQHGYLERTISAMRKWQGP